MLFMVTGVGALIHLYSLGYMGTDEGQIALLRLPLALYVLDARHRAREQFRDDVHFLGTGRDQFLFAHRPLVRTHRGSEAAKKAFITNRLGDFGFMLGILMVWSATGSLVFQRNRPENGEVRHSSQAI